MFRRSLLTAAAAVMASPARAEADAIRLSHGLGILYLPLIVMREAKLVEKHAAAAGVPVTVSWATLDGAGPINDALISGNLDIAGNSVPGFLTIWSKSQGTRSEVIGVAGLSSAALVLNTNRPEIRTLADFRPGDKIAVPSAKVSVQAVVLQMAAAQVFGETEWARLDTNTISLQHPNAAAALISGNRDVAAHFASPPFSLAEAAAPNIHTVLRSPDVVGDITIDMVFGARRFTSANPRLVRAFLAAQREANALIASNPGEAAALFIRNSGTKVDPAEIVRLLRDPETRFDTTPHGFMQFARFMLRAGTIRMAPKDWRDAFVPELEGDGS